MGKGVHLVVRVSTICSFFSRYIDYKLDDSYEAFNKTIDEECQRLSRNGAPNLYHSLEYIP